MRLRKLSGASLSAPLALLAALSLGPLGCGAPTSAAFVASPQARLGALSPFAEGVCPKLSMAAVGDRRFLVYGDDGYALQGWLPGERLAAAESIAEIRGGGAFRNPAILRGLPREGRGYVPFDIDLGGSFDRRAWLMLVAAKYAGSGAGSLFERTSVGYAFEGNRWSPFAGDGPVDFPEAARSLPPLAASGMCGDATRAFVPLASAKTPEGGVFIAGRCDDAAVTNVRGSLVVAHGLPNASAWRVDRLPAADDLDGIVNLSIDARSDEEAALVAYEPFVPTEKRHSYFAELRGGTWRAASAGIDEGLMSVASDAGGVLYFAAGRGLYRRDPAGEVSRVALPPLTFTPAAALHVRRVQVPSPGEIWVEASYSIRLRARGDQKQGPEVRGGAIFSTIERAHEVFCDARETEENALYEVP